MKISNKNYDRLKWFALNFIPAFEVLILTLGRIWGLPYYAEIGATVAAVGVFLAAVLGLSSKNYYAADEGEKDPDEDEEDGYGY